MNKNFFPVTGLKSFRKASYFLFIPRNGSVGKRTRSYGGVLREQHPLPDLLCSLTDAPPKDPLPIPPGQLVKLSSGHVACPTTAQPGQAVSLPLIHPPQASQDVVTQCTHFRWQGRG